MNWNRNAKEMFFYEFSRSKPDYLAWYKASTVKTGYKNHLNRGNSGYRGHFAADQFFYLIKTS